MTVYSSNVNFTNREQAIELDNIQCAMGGGGANYRFCHVTSELLLKVIEYRYSVSVQKASVVAGLRCRKLRR